MATLSVLYLTRNDDAVLKKSMDSIVGIADEIVVIDAGSVDTTTKIVRQYRNTKLITHGWVHDFSKSRNFGLAHCTSDWIMYVDSDEFLDPKSAAAVKAAIQRAGSNISGFSLHVVDHPVRWEKDDPGCKPFFPSPQVRVFRRNPVIRFEGRVMESVRATAESAGAIDVLDARVHHFAWRGKGDEFAKMKIGYYRKLGAALPDPGGYDEMAEATDRVMPAPRLSAHAAVVVVAYNHLDKTKQCVNSITRYMDQPIDLILVNNGSTDGTESYMRDVVPGRAPISFQRNEGVAKGRNAGAEEALRNPSLKYVCFLDNDTIVSPGWIETMTSLLDSDDKLAIVGPVTTSGPDAQNVSGQYSSMSVDAMAQVLPSRSPEMIGVEEVGGFCMVVRAEILKKIGMFDESFGLYGFEAEDMCRRVRTAGYKIAIANRAYVIHRGGGTVKATPSVNWHSIMLTSAVRYKTKWNLDQASWPVQSGGGTPSIASAKAKPSSARVSIVIIAHNRLDRTRKCLESIARTTSNYELIFVDNASTDGTADYVRRFGGIKVITNPTNVGVPKARNQGIRASTAPYVVLMDNDIEVKEGWLTELLEPLQRGAVDVVGTEAWQINSDLCASHKCSHSGDRYDYLGGACTVTRRRVFEVAGLLDENFSPAYYEDVEFSLRAKDRGFKLHWIPSKHVIHHEHSTLVHGQKTFSYQDALTRSQQYFARKRRGQVMDHKDELLPPLFRRLRIMYLAMYHDYGVPERGTSFEHENFYPSFVNWERTAELSHFDFVALGKQHGIPKMSDMLLDEVQRFCPDALFAIFFDPNHDPRREALQKISRTTPTRTIGWFCDSHWRYDNFDRPWADYLDYNVTTSQSAHERYLKDGLGGKVIKSQWAAAPSYRKIPGITRNIGVSFVGQPHGDRRAVIEQLRRAGIHIETYGTGWGKRLTFDEMIDVFNRSKINLNLNNASDARYKQIKGRNFEVPGCGGLLLTELAENLGDYYVPDKEIVTYGATKDLPDIIRHYLVHDDLRESIADAAYARTMAEHTYAHRFNHLFAKAGLI